MRDKLFPFETGRAGGEHPKFNERDSDDLQHLVILQHIRANDITLCEDNQSDDYHMQSLHQHGRFQDLGSPQVDVFPKWPLL